MSFAFALFIKTLYSGKYGAKTITSSSPLPDVSALRAIVIPAAAPDVI